MKVRVLRHPYPKSEFIIGDVYDAKSTIDGKNYMVLSKTGLWLCLFPNELQFICPAVMVPANG